MAYDEGLAERIRGILTDEPAVAEKRMFGGLAFLLRGNMCVGVVKDELMVRVGPQRYEELLRQPHARRMDFTGRPMKGMVTVLADHVSSEEDVADWVERAVTFVETLPAKEAVP